MDDGKLPDVLYDELARGLQLLLALRLGGAPAADTVGATADAWERALCAKKVWDGQRDCGRFAAGFDVLAATCRYWPAPVDLLAALPPPPQPLLLEHRYLAKTPEELARGQARVKAILGRLADAKSVR